jgi:hypothetical protein
VVAPDERGGRRAGTYGRRRKPDRRTKLALTEQTDQRAGMLPLVLVRKGLRENVCGLQRGVAVLELVERLAKAFGKESQVDTVSAAKVTHGRVLAGRNHGTSGLLVLEQRRNDWAPEECFPEPLGRQRLKAQTMVGGHYLSLRC